MVVKMTKSRLKTIHEFDKKLQELEKRRVIIGINKDAVSKTGVEVAKYAYWNDRGVPSKNIPARPFFRSVTTLGRSKDEIQTYVDGVIRDMFKLTLTPEQALDRIGLFLKGRVVNSIRNGNWISNNPETLKHKTSSNPLIDKGQLIRSVEYEIK